jgi:hypothetical protein
VPVPGDALVGERVAEFMELFEDMAAFAEPTAVRDMLYDKPRRKGGGS